jgi:hypothetical protein
MTVSTFFSELFFNYRTLFLLPITGLFLMKKLFRTQMRGLHYGRLIVFLLIKRDRIRRLFLQINYYWHGKTIPIGQVMSGNNETVIVCKNWNNNRIYISFHA